MPVLVVGSIGLDTVKTPLAEHADLLGGSASYAAVGASFFTGVNLVGIVGEDFPQPHVDFFGSRNIDLCGLQIAQGKTFRWSGEYHTDLNTRSTRSIDLNVFEHFTPKLPPAYNHTQYVLLANIAPSLQSHVLDQMTQPRFIIADTMDLWLNVAKPDLLALLKRVDMLILNDGEARLLTGENSLIKAGKLIQKLGPKYVALKKGEHGCLLFGENAFFSCGAFPLEDIHDPTGAGDTFAGGLAGYLASLDQGEITFETLRKAVVYGSVLASYNVEAFSLERMRTLTPKDIEHRFNALKAISSFEELN